MGPCTANAWRPTVESRCRDSEDGEDDELPCVIAESAGDCADRTL